MSSYVGRSEHELAGGIEDWEDLEGAEVDRYGFILVHRQHQERGASPELGAPQRVSTVGPPYDVTSPSSIADSI